MLIMLRSLVLHVPCFYFYLFLFYDFRWLVEMIALEKACKLFFHIATSFRIRGFFLPKDVPNFKFPFVARLNFPFWKRCKNGNRRRLHAGYLYPCS